MKQKLVIMESPTKTKAVQHYLGKHYLVVSSEGHIRNLSTKGQFGLGIDVSTFTPDYKIERGKGKLVKDLINKAKNASEVILATDPDREGEAIAYHLDKVLNVSDKVSRVRFNEITKDAINDAFQNKTIIDLNLVKAQETRRMLDRFIGFRLSKLLQKKIKSKSAGRVQSVALKLIVKREKEYQDFKPSEYWTIEGKYKLWLFKLLKYNNEKIELLSQKDVINVKDKLGPDFIVSDINKSEKVRHSPFPYTTSTMFQDSSIQLNFQSSKTSLLAQQLYEGIMVNKELVGFITYPRTDSIRFSDKFVDDGIEFIKTEFGNNYVGTVKINKPNKKNVQDAHEAIRPTDLKMTPELAKNYLSKDQQRLYKIIYEQALSSLMADAIMINTSININNNGYEFRITTSSILFDGYLKCKNNIEEKTIRSPQLDINQKIKVNELMGLQHFTKPPARYSEAKLIKTLEEIGVGRPSTYAPIIKVLRERGYIVVENKALKATERGILTVETLEKWFSDLINEEYTSQVESHLDSISQGKIDNKTLLSEFWNKFEPRVEEALLNMQELVLEKPNLNCPKCGHELVYRFGKFGKFIGCSSFPKCRYIQPFGETYGICPKCQKGQVILKINKRNQKFKACSNFAETGCDYTEIYKKEKLSDENSEIKSKNLKTNKNEKLDNEGLLKINLLI